MNKIFNFTHSKIVVLGTLLLCGASVSYLTGFNNRPLQAHEPEEHQSSDHHKMVDIPPDQPTPQLDLIVHSDARQGWNLELNVKNFKFTPEKVNQASQSYQEGHAHLYVNGKKITRIYSNWYYLPELEPGQNQVTVSLTGNGHEMFMVQGKEIKDTEVINIP